MLQTGRFFEVHQITRWNDRRLDVSSVQTPKTFWTFFAGRVTLTVMTPKLSTRQRSLPHRSRRNLPVAPLPDPPLRYVTDNLRDAEALARTVDSPVFVRVTGQDREGSPLSPSAAASVRTSERSERLGRLDAADVSDVSDASV